MRRALILVAAAVAACAPTAPSKGLAAFTDADLANAINIAQQAAPGNPEAPMIVTCLTYLKTQLANLPLSASASSGATVGAATAFVEADLAIGSLADATGPSAQALFATNCGPLITYKLNRAIPLGAQVTGLGALLAPKF